MVMQETCAVILAAGKGTRMKSHKPKVLMEVLFKPMLDWVMASATGAGIEKICVVTGHCAEMVEAHLNGKHQAVLQEKQLGTGHAVMQAREFIEKCGGDVLILNGDAPFMDCETILNAHKHHVNAGNAVTVITADIANPYGYGRILRDRDDYLTAIREEKDASDEEKKIREVNSGAYWFNAKVLLSVLDKLTNENASGEYYLTDAVQIIVSRVLHAGAYKTNNANVVLGANDRIQLAQLNMIARKELLRAAYCNGVDIPCTDGVVIGPDVSIGMDTTILPGTILTGHTAIGEGCVIGPNSHINDTTVGNGTSLNNVWAEKSVVGENCAIGPFVQIRPNSRIGNQVHLGNFVEVKNSSIDEGTKVSHLTYVGDSDVGRFVNFGCGCVTVNYNGKEKNRTVIGDHAFIGCNTNLIAPVEIGEYGYTAAGSTITDNVPDKALSIARARQVNKENWVMQNDLDQK